jgi:large conductance mechanosensitive channel
MGFIKEFKEFAIKGNVIDLAIAVVIGAAFGRIVTALTQSIIMPIVGMFVDARTIADLTFTLNGTVFPYGVLLQAIVDFILIALVLFLIIKGINRMNRKREQVAPAPPEYTLTEKLLMEIRDGLNR